MEHERARLRIFSISSLPGVKWVTTFVRTGKIMIATSRCPPWAQKTLHEHAADERPNVYALDEFEAAATHDPLWNAAQGQLLREGHIHNYMRMLWGKKILEWSVTPRESPFHFDRAQQQIRSRRP